MVRCATLKDVAELAEVSTATVARVLHNKGYVAQDTRRLVERALLDTGYQINAIAQGLRRQRTFTIGHVMKSIIPDQFFASVADGVEEVAFRHNCGVLMITTHDDRQRERRAVETLIQRRVDAIIFTTATHVDNVRLAEGAGVPIVQVERMTSVNTPMVTADNFGGAYAAVEHLIHLGHVRIGFIGVDPARMGSRPGSARHPNIEQERLSGYLAALSDHNIPVTESLIGLEPGYTDEPDSEQKRGYRIMQSLLSVSLRPTAVFCTFDLLAAAALQAIYDRGLRVPDDISVVGFDDTHAPYLTPPVTAVMNPTIEMGKVAANLVLKPLDRSASETEIAKSGRRLPMKLQIRASTGPPPQVEQLDPDNSDGHVSSMTPVSGIL